MARTKLTSGPSTGSEPLIISPGLKRFGEQPDVDALTCGIHYIGTPRAMGLHWDDTAMQDLAHATAHLLHDSSEGRFRTTNPPRPPDPRDGGEFVNLIQLEPRGGRAAHLTLEPISHGPRRYLAPRPVGRAGRIESSIGGGCRHSRLTRYRSRKSTYVGWQARGLDVFERGLTKCNRAGRPTCCGSAGPNHVDLSGCAN